MRKYIAFLAMIPVCSSDVCSKLVLATIDEKVFAGTAVVTLIAGGSIGILRDNILLCIYYLLDSNNIYA